MYQCNAVRNMSCRAALCERVALGLAEYACIHLLRLVAASGAGKSAKKQSELLCLLRALGGVFITHKGCAIRTSDGNS